MDYTRFYSAFSYFEQLSHCLNSHRSVTSDVTSCRDGQSVTAQRLLC